jgi:hypothetical protein
MPLRVVSHHARAADVMVGDWRFDVEVPAPVSRRPVRRIVVPWGAFVSDNSGHCRSKGSPDVIVSDIRRTPNQHRK